MATTDLSINELTPKERHVVLRTLLRTIGADTSLEALAKSKEWVQAEKVLGTLNLPNWPTSQATPTELAWLSEPLPHHEFSRLRGYSVFWSFSSDLEVWIGRTSHRPRDASSLLLGAALLGAIIHMYGFKLQGHNRYNASVFLRKSLRGRIALYLFILLVPAVVIFTYLYFQYGLTLRTYLPVLTFFVSFLYTRFALKYLPKDTFLLLWPLAIYFVSPYIFHNPSEYEPFGSDVDYPHVTGISVSLVLATWVVMLKATPAQLMESWEEIIRNRFRYLREVLALISVVTVTGYTAYVLHTFVLYQVLVEGNMMFLFLIVFGVIALFEFLHRMLKR